MNLILQSLRVPLGPHSLELDACLSGNAIGVFGRSGAGKTTLLETIAGLKKPERGRMELDGRVLSDASRSFSLPPQQRRIGYVPQDLALFPHLSVRQNLAYGTKAPAAETSPTPWEQILSVLEIGGLLDRGTATLSGGEKQRVAFARALMASPRLLLLDEPLANLNRSLRRKILEYLIQIRRDLGIPLIYVSHDAFEIETLCDALLVLEEGRVAAQGNPAGILPGLAPVSSGESA
jgi:molybdate transport system ATP-binding protein